MKIYLSLDRKPIPRLAGEDTIVIKAELEQAGISGRLSYEEVFRLGQTESLLTETLKGSFSKLKKKVREYQASSRSSPEIVFERTPREYVGILDNFILQTA